MFNPYFIASLRFYLFWEGRVNLYCEMRLPEGTSAPCGPTVDLSEALHRPIYHGGLGIYLDFLQMFC